MNQKIEAARISIRNVREEIWRMMKEQKTDGTISEDDMHLQQKNLQKTVDTYNETVKELATKKEAEIMTI
jgi:ribosome recycling factor